jgi:hypothetical protein
LGIKGADDLWGGFVEHDFICTKAISHGLRSHLAHAPQGWAPLFSERVRDVVLDGLTVFALDDARPAAEHLLYSGPIRLKPIHACAGRGQEVINSLDAFDEVLARVDAAALFRDGVVLEQDLSKVVTHSVGQSFIGGKVLSYCGDQYLTKDAHGEDVYGGSNAGGAGRLRRVAGAGPADDVRLAIQQAQVFDRPRTKPTRVSMPRGATTTSLKAWTATATAQRRARTILAHGRCQQRRNGGAAELRQRPGRCGRSVCLPWKPTVIKAITGGRHRGVSRPAQEQRFSPQVRNGQIL